MAEINFTTTRAQQYKDLSLSMDKNPVTSDVIAVSDAEAVKRSIKTLLYTVAGEVPFFPEFGSRLNRLLFEPIDPITTALLNSEIAATIQGFEPRVKMTALNITPTPDESKYQVDIELQLIALAQPMSVSLFLSRLR